MPKLAYIALAFIGCAASVEIRRGPYEVRHLERRNDTGVYQTARSTVSNASSVSRLSDLSEEPPLSATTTATSSAGSQDETHSSSSSSSSRPVQTTEAGRLPAVNTTVSSGSSSASTLRSAAAAEDTLLSNASNTKDAMQDTPLDEPASIPATGLNLANGTSGYNSSIASPSILPATAEAVPSSDYTYITSRLRPYATGASDLFANISNGTRISSGYHPQVTATYRPTGYVGPRPNQTCGGATVNIVGASLDWWYTETYTQVDSTFVVQLDDKNSSTAWTLLPATSTFDVTTAVANPTCLSSTGLNPSVNETEVLYSCVDTPTPTAVATTTLEQTAYKDIDVTTSRGDIPDVVTTPTPAAITVADNSATYSAGTPFVHFSHYEVVSKRPFRYGYGRVGCAETTRVHTLSTAGSFEYTGGDVDGSYAAVAGDLHQLVLGDLGEHTATAGSFVAEPTVVVVVEKIVAAARMFKAMLQPSQAVLELPSATLPPDMSEVPITPTEAGTTWAPVAPHIERTASELVVPTPKPTIAMTTRVNSPFVAHVEGHDITLAIPVDRATPQAVVTAIFNGATVTATAVKNGGGDFGGIVSAVAEVARPDNALEVLSNAQLTYSKPNRIAQAIASAMGDTSGKRPARPQQAPILTIGNSVFTASAAGGGGKAVIIGGQTLSAGGLPITVGGTPVSLAPGATEVVVGTLAFKIDTTPNPGMVANIPLITVGSRTITANAATQFRLAGTILTPGGTAVVSGTTVILESHANRVVINGQTSSLSPPAITLAPLITLDGTIYQANIGTTYDIASHFLTPGGAVTISGTTISLPLTGSVLFVNGLAQPTALGGLQPNILPTITAPPALILNGNSYMPNGAAAYLVFSQTLTPGGRITYTNTLGGIETVSLDASLHTLLHISDSQTRTSLLSPIGASPDGAPVLTIYGKTYTAQAYSPGMGATYIIAGQTLTAGGTILHTLPSGETETISLLQPGTAVAITGPEGHVTTSTILDAYAVLPTSPPLLILGDEVFAAINPGATYIIDGHTLVPAGNEETVTVDGRTYHVSLAAQATAWEVSEIGAAGGTRTEALFPARMTGSTFVNSAEATQGLAAETGAAGKIGGGGGTGGVAGDGDENIGSGLEVKRWVASGLVVGTTFFLAVWL
ncbi:Ca2+-modulated nonselective cation channel polycystin [Zymoseptoria tritici IPO323]|uniref:Ca2+-modulated nonselective cation channel polycystin n=2 Tax=Zymoseptoria tritici TaxID=1047171 RepID=F9WZR7_ZYMTI|nr:Ca2+-modulated nonselective cation channel polycystin [Zymoseptoria tritici IPO323]EGP92581.1 Ca2+-modulated nonselective cation channel polycystin [Zymoseptoria tritici IPO323]